MSDRMAATLVCDALRMALFRRKRPRGVIMHADRGSQYCSREHRDLLDASGLVASMSAKGNCYDNAAMESWNHSLKVEAIHGERLTSRKQAKDVVFEYIEVDYNRNRLHSVNTPQPLPLKTRDCRSCHRRLKTIGGRLPMAWWDRCSL